MWRLKSPLLQPCHPTCFRNAHNGTNALWLAKDLAGCELLGQDCRPRLPPLISVIIPTSDRGYVLREAIDSVLAQSHEEVELIVVDDGSTDGTGDLVANEYGSDPRVRYSYQTNSGVASARNAGLDLARGESWHSLTRTIRGSPGTCDS